MLEIRMHRLMSFAFTKMAMTKSRATTYPKILRATIYAPMP
jgi:hypothetical protein